MANTSYAPKLDFDQKKTSGAGKRNVNTTATVPAKSTTTTTSSALHSPANAAIPITFKTQGIDSDAPKKDLSLLRGRELMYLDDGGYVPQTVAETPMAETTGVDVGGGSPTVPTIPNNDDTVYQNALAQAIEAYQNAGQNKLDALTQNYNMGRNNLQAAYNQKADALKQSNDEALRQAYINYMMGIKNLSQDLSNAGINGGAAESLLANMYNNYGNNRASIQNQTRGNLADLAANFNEGMANLTSGYNNNYADALNDMYSRIAGVQADYAGDEANRNYQLQLANAKANASASGSNSGSASTGLSNDEYKRAISTIQNWASNGNYKAILDYLDLLGIDGTQGDKLLIESGVNPSSLGQYFYPKIETPAPSAINMNPITRNMGAFRSRG